MQFIEGFAASRAAIEQANAARAFDVSPEMEALVREICENVRLNGDDALVEYGRKFDCPELKLEDLRVDESEMNAAWRALSSTAKTALERAARNIETFHQAQSPPDFEIQTPEGARLGNRFSPIERVGLYAPNGRAAYPSSVLMIAIPARVAGVDERVLGTPAGRDGQAHPVILAAAQIAGITEIYKIGGAAAMAAFAYGTPTVRRVDKVVGPANIYGTLAKKHLFGTVGIDGLYGPSDVAIVADEHQNASQLAADLLAQAEHGADSWTLFLSNSRALCENVMREVELQTRESPRAEIALQALENSLVCFVDEMEQACELCDLAAAEHVEIWSSDARKWSLKVRNAGAIFLNCPVPLGDYIIGPSHALPTGATARYASGVGVDTFLKRTSIIEAPRETVAKFVDDLEIIARLEELPGHAEAVRRATQ